MSYSDIGKAQSISMDAAVSVQHTRKWTFIHVYPFRKMEGIIRYHAADGREIAMRKISYAFGQATSEKFGRRFDVARISFDGRTIWEDGGSYRETESIDSLEALAGTDTRSAAFTKMAMEYYRRGEMTLSEKYARKALLYGAQNITALQLLYQIHPSEKILGDIERINPLCPFPDAERMLDSKIGASVFASRLTQKDPYQQYLELSLFYLNLGIRDKACAMLAALPEHNVLTYTWYAYLLKAPNLIQKAELFPLPEAEPLLKESLGPLLWAEENGGGWKFRYLIRRIEGSE